MDVCLTCIGLVRHVFTPFLSLLPTFQTEDTLEGNNFPVGKKTISFKSWPHWKGNKIEITELLHNDENFEKRSLTHPKTYYKKHTVCP